MRMRHQQSNENYSLFSPDYPQVKIGYTLDRLSIKNVYSTAPSDKQPQSDWVWEFDPIIWPAVYLFLSRSGVSFEEEKET